ncbi:MAG TPA: LuxR C-terminal-related transcriptional regulator [Gemmatimonadaceae bacterium]|jgi:DNA-binding NarL/FixJ family response regulator|nr:LuxR C-terminal-related transcriptional regulator [Gemmatimonadaceae bacterium]
MQKAGSENPGVTLRPESSSLVAAVERGRDAFARGAWRAAFTELSAADSLGPLDCDDLALLAGAAHLLGETSASAAAWERAHRAALDAGDARGAARATFWLSLGLLVRRNIAHATGWMARGVRVLDEAAADSEVLHDCVERGYLRFTEALRHAVERDAVAAERTFADAAAIGARFDDRNLVALARHAQGRALIFSGDPARGATLLDETLIALESGEVAALFVGDIYCSAVDACREMYDLTRAAEWTAALDRWCESQSDQIVYRGMCAIHRAEIVRLRGEWNDAAAELDRAREWFARQPAHFGVGLAWYEIGEIHRLRGAFDDADAAYRMSSRAGYDPQPGLSLLRLAQGKATAAKASIRRAVDEAELWPIRSRRLPALVEIALAAGDVDLARQGAGELAELARAIGAPLLGAASSFANGAVALADGDPRSALTALRAAATISQAVNVPYDVARARVLVAVACRALGDDEAAELELDAAREQFQQLGARPDVARVDALRRGSPSVAGGLTSRETEVLRHIAKGETNRAIASALRISEKTVARHVSNIFLKLNVPNRAAATAFAHERGVVPSAAFRST